MNSQPPFEGKTTRLPQYTEPRFDRTAARTDDFAQPTYPPSIGAPVARRRRGGLGALLLGVGLALLLVPAIGASYQPFESGFTESTTSITEQFDGAKNLRLDVGGGNVRLVRGDVDQVGVEAIIHGFGWTSEAARRSAERETPEISQAGNTVHIKSERSGSFVFFGNSPYIDYRIMLPADAAVDMSTGSGDIEAGEFSGPLDLRTGSGTITLRQIEGPLTLSLGSGNVRIEGGELDGARIQTGSGDINVDDVRGSLEAQTGSGSIVINDAEALQMDLRTGSGDITFDGSLSDTDASRAKVGSGRIKLTLPDNTNAEVKANTSSGTISSDWELDGGEHSRRGELGSGGTELILEASSGDISIERD